MSKNVTLILGLLTLTACSSTPQNPDPHEEFNRDMTDFNVAVDKNVVKPASTGYKVVTTEPIRMSVSSFLFNAKEPFYLVNYVLQGDVEQATNSIFRFVINTTFGVLGLFDVASEIGLSKRETSYKETLRKWEMPSGDYLVLPILSSSSTRDIIAEPISWFADPISYVIGWPWMLTKAALGAIDNRTQNGKTIDATLQNSMDPYPLMKNVYLQKYAYPEPRNEDEDF